MEIVVDVDSARYPYMQIADELRRRIATGEIAHRVPSINELLETVTPRPAYNTVRRAIDVLKKEGLVETAPGRGTFVKRETP